MRLLRERSGGTYSDPTASEAIYRMDRRFVVSIPESRKPTSSVFSPRAAPEHRAVVLGELSQQLAELPGSDPRRRRLVRNYNKLVELQRISRSRGHG